MDHEDIAFGIVEDYLNEGPEYIAIVETVADEGGDDSDTEAVALIVRETLTRLARDFNVVGGFE